jgi:hypothetical protein
VGISLTISAKSQNQPGHQRLVLTGDAHVAATHGERVLTSLAADTTHVENTVREELRAGLPELVTEVEEHHPLGGLSSGVPRRQGPQATGDVSRLGDTEQQPGGDERAVVGLEGLEGGYQAEEEQLKREPSTGTDPV